MSCPTDTPLNGRGVFNFIDVIVHKGHHKAKNGKTMVDIMPLYPMNAYNKDKFFKSVLLYGCHCLVDIEDVKPID